VEDLAQDTAYDPAHKRGAVEQGYRGFIGVPLRSQGRILGALNIFTKGARHFLPDEIALLTALADQASVTIEEARLYEASRARARELDERNTQLRHLHEAARAITAERDVERLLQTIVESSRELLGAGYGALGVFNADGRIRQFFTVGLTPEAREGIAGPPVGQGLLGYVFKHGKTLRLDDLTAHPAAAGFPPGHPPMRSLLAVPIHFRQQILGALYLTEKPGGFTAEDEALLATLSADAALAIETARLFDETRTQQTRLTQIFDSTSDGILLVSRTGEIQAVNRRAGELLGFNAEDAVGVGLAELLAGYRSSVPDYARVFAALNALLEAPDRGGEGDLDLRRMGRIIHWTGQPTRDTAGRTLGLTLTLRDVTQEREVSQMKTDFVSFVTHQLRTPLAGIKWMLELVQEAPGVPAEPLSYVQDARQAAERLIGLVNDLLDVSRLEGGKLKIEPRPVDLGDLTRSVLEELVTLVREKGHRLSVEGADTAPQVVADPQLLRQVVLNLTSNAIKYTPPGGDVTIRMESGNGNVRWAITDSGIGIPKASQARLFEKFYRADNAQTFETEGTGLGLYLVRLILEKLSGRVSCESEEGQGATFLFTLPVSGRGQ
ncbi:MAG: GAF domain-containing protein, partial [Candidatus Rokubacteria bacterium]|nr:GAF domain-containing protein [Candidatus Rokubacteria bacterium]